MSTEERKIERSVQNEMDWEIQKHKKKINKKKKKKLKRIYLYEPTLHSPLLNT